MSVIIEISVPAEDFALGRSLEGIESTQFELERMIPTTDAVVPFFWAHDTDPAALETALEADEDVIGVDMLDKLDNRALFRVEWVPDIDGLDRRATRGTRGGIRGRLLQRPAGRYDQGGC